MFFRGLCIFLQPPEGNSPPAVSIRRLPQMVVMMICIDSDEHNKFSIKLACVISLQTI